MLSIVDTRTRAGGGGGGRGEVRQELCGRARGIRRLKGNEQRGGGGNAIHLILEWFSGQRRVPRHDLLEPVQINEEGAGANEVNMRH